MDVNKIIALQGIIIKLGNIPSMYKGFYREQSAQHKNKRNVITRKVEGNECGSETNVNEWVLITSV